MFIFDSTGFDSTVYDAITANLCQFPQSNRCLFLTHVLLRLLTVKHSLHIRPVYLLQIPEEPAEPRSFLTISYTSRELPGVSLDEIRVPFPPNPFLCGHRNAPETLDIHLSTTTREKGKKCGVVRRVKKERREAHFVGGTASLGRPPSRKNRLFASSSFSSDILREGIDCQSPEVGKERGRAKRRTEATCTFASPRIAGGTPK